MKLLIWPVDLKFKFKAYVGKVNKFWESHKKVLGFHQFFVAFSEYTDVSKGQLISKGHFGVIVWTKKPTKFLPGFLP